MVQNSEEWMSYRAGKITGSKLNDIIVLKGNKKKDGFYQLIADRMAGEEDHEDPMERGHRLEPGAIEAFEKATGKKCEKVGICIHDKHPEIAYSPDGLIKNGDKYTESVEVKCLKSASHIRVLREKTYTGLSNPNSFRFQILQGFIVNEDLEKLYLVFYDPRITVKPLHWLEFTRKELEDDIKEFLEYQIKELKEIDIILEELAF